MVADHKRIVVLKDSVSRPRLGNVVMNGVGQDESESVGRPVELLEADDDGQIFIIAYNEGGYCHTKVHLVDLLRWVRANRQPLWREIDKGA